MDTLQKVSIRNEEARIDHESDMAEAMIHGSNSNNQTSKDDDISKDPDWVLVGITNVTAVSTCKGSKKLLDNEIVDFSFPSSNSSNSTKWIVRFSTKRSGEIGRLPMEWAKCVVPLVDHGQVRVSGRCIRAPEVLSVMEEIILCVSCYIQHSDYEAVKRCAPSLDVSPTIGPTNYALLTLFKWLKVQPYQKCVPEESASNLSRAKRRNSLQHNPEENKDNHTISEIVGTEAGYNLEEMEPSSTLKCDLAPYQKQALYWMSQLEKATDVDAQNHLFWEADNICDERATSIYLDMLLRDATTQFPITKQMARRGLLVDARELGKTLITTALILTTPRSTVKSVNLEITKKRKIDSDTSTTMKPKGGTLIVCPRSLLCQWKEELQTHSKSGSISVFVYDKSEYLYDKSAFLYDKPDHITVDWILNHDVVLTEYDILAFAYDFVDSIFHEVDWYRVVFDEAPSLESCSDKFGVQALYTLSSHCRWWLTETPLEVSNLLSNFSNIQINPVGIYSLLCFLHVEPWCNPAWFVQKLLESDNSIALRLINGILRPFMLKSTVQTEYERRRPIFALRPNIEQIECTQSEAEQEFYASLFKRSKVQFDQFVAQGKVLDNYENILELLLRLRQCCNHPFLVMSQGDLQEFADLDKLSSKVMETSHDFPTSKQTLPIRAYGEEVVESTFQSENKECLICLDFADDPVLTPCEHLMCRECLLSRWRFDTSGKCPKCWEQIEETDLITCTPKSHLQLDDEKIWKESSKVTMLMDCLENIVYSHYSDISIVFSQWTSSLDILEIAMKRRGIKFFRMDGKLERFDRMRVLMNCFVKDTKVLLICLKTGGDSDLDLTDVSNIFLMDPPWNAAAEEAAIRNIILRRWNRTVVKRFIVKDTVEERMQQIQTKAKRRIAHEQDRSARIEELKMLFA